MKRSEPNPLTRTNSAAPSREEIALRAHQLWCQQGCPQGHDLDNWFEAERQLLEEYDSRPIPASEDVSHTRPDREEGPYSAFSDDAPLAAKVEDQVIQPGAPASRESPTSLEI